MSAIMRKAFIDDWVKDDSKAGIYVKNDQILWKQQRLTQTVDEDAEKCRHGSY